MTKKTVQIGILGLLALGLLLWQGCNVRKAAYETRQQAEFASSGHAAEGSEAFRHWDHDNPPLVPTGCAKCHSVGGFIEYASTGAVTAAAQPGAFTCSVCHTGEEGGALREFTAGVRFPSGVTVTDAGKEAVCLNCHQGRTSYKDIDTAVAGKPADTPDSRIRFSNIHYHVAAASLYGTKVKGGYEYAGNTYDQKFSHVAGYNGCTDCHNPHSLEVKVGNCDTCHSGVKSRADLHDIRWYGSLTDYDGDGDTHEGMYDELHGVMDQAMLAIQAYARQVAGVAIAYSPTTYPYFIKDTNGNGVVDPGETSSYTAFTPRLLKACYNFQMASKDPGGFAHGGKYLIQLLYDAMADLGGATPEPVDMSSLHRNDEGHFDGSSMAWRDWDDTGTVPNTCARCHSATGLGTFLATGANVAVPVANGMLCTTCHTSPPAMRTAATVTFPSGLKATLGDSSNLCMVCHQGRAAKKTVDTNIASKPGDYSFNNIHYFPAAAVFYGTDVQGGYEYPGKTYAGRNPFPNHEGKFNTCVSCHMGVHAVRGHNVAEPEKENCVACHGQDISQPNPGGDAAHFEFSGIRPASIPDFDGDGNSHESLKSEIEGLQATLYARIQSYALAIGKPVIYNTSAYPYWFKDLNGNGVLDEAENSSANSYKFDAALLKAGYNLHTSIKEPNGYIHNPWYIAQLLVDSIGDLGGSTAPYTWR